MTSTSSLPLRADAQRNREQLIAAAARTFVSGGPDVPVEEIARPAGWAWARCTGAPPRSR